MPAEMSPMCHSLGVDGPFHRSTNLLRSIPTKLFLSLSVSSCFLLYFLLSSFVLTLFYTLYCCSCTNIFISLTPNEHRSISSTGSGDQCPVSHCGGPVSFPGQSVWSSCQAKGHSFVLSVLIWVYMDNGHISSHSQTTERARSGVYFKFVIRVRLKPEFFVSFL